MTTASWEGVAGTTGDHRTVGHRAHCPCDPDDSPNPWCYPDDLCACCHEALGHRMIWVDKEGKEVEG